VFKSFILKVYWKCMYTVLIQKGNQDIIKVVHVTSVGYLQCLTGLERHEGEFLGELTL